MRNDIFKNRTVVISGASGGLGTAIAKSFAKNGANVSFSYFNNKKEALKLKNEILSMGVKVKASKVDITDTEQSRAWINKTHKEFNNVDMLVNNAGILIPGAIVFTKHDDIKKVIETNLYGTLIITKIILEYFLKEERGNIINISSALGVTGGLPAVYSASKAGIIGMTKSVAKEVAGYGIRVNAISPGYCNAGMVHKYIPKAKKDELIKKIPLGRFAAPDEVSELVMFLCSEKSRYITGQNIVIDGGLSISQK